MSQVKSSLSAELGVMVIVETVIASQFVCAIPDNVAITQASITDTTHSLGANEKISFEILKDPLD